MQDQDFIEQFENCTFPVSDFDHSNHVKLAWLYLRRYPVLEAAARVSDGIKRFAAHNGKAGLYHETITWAYVFLINERLHRTSEELSWQQFVDTNPDLFDWKQSILKKYYSDETLKSDLARKIFVLPDTK
jgi:hypothetical protein